MLQKRRNTANRAGLALDIDQRERALGRRIKFDDMRDVEALLERIPDIGTQAIAEGEPHMMRALVGIFGRLEKIAAELADILKQGAVPANHILPEAPRRKLILQHDRAAANEHAADGHNAADAV